MTDECPAVLWGLGVGGKDSASCPSLTFAGVHGGAQPQNKYGERVAYSHQHLLDPRTNSAKANYDTTSSPLLSLSFFFSRRLLFAFCTLMFKRCVDFIEKAVDNRTREAQSLENGVSVCVCVCVCEGVGGLCRRKADRCSASLVWLCGARLVDAQLTACVETGPRSGARDWTATSHGEERKNKHVSPSSLHLLHLLAPETRHPPHHFHWPDYSFKLSKCGSLSRLTGPNHSVKSKSQVLKMI